MSYQGIYIGYKGTNQHRVYDLQSGRVFITRDMHFDAIHHYDRKDLKPQDFANDKWHKEDNELFADPINIFDVSKPISPLVTTRKIYETYPYSDELRISSLFSDISN